MNRISSAPDSVPTRRWIPWWRCVWVLGLTVLAGCDDGGTSQGPARGVDALLARYTAADRMQDPARSDEMARMHEEALGFGRTVHGADRATAAYVAGLTAYRLGKFDDADLAFSDARSRANEAGDSTQVALAQASIGLVRLQQGRPGDAALLLEEAYADLPYAERADAARVAADAHAAAGHLVDARRWMTQATATPELVDDGGFALQAGAFRERTRAVQAARSTAELPGAGVFGDVSIHSKSGVGGDYFVVQLGRFATRRDATMARERLGRVDLLVTDAMEDGAAVVSHH